MLKLLGVGLPRTGTRSLCEALRILGYNAIHHEPDRIDLDTVDENVAQAYDDVEAVTDMPAALFHREIPAEKYILTTRPVDDWWHSIVWHTQQILIGGDAKHIRYTQQLHAAIFGSAWPQEFLWKKRYDEWQLQVLQGPISKHVQIFNICVQPDWTQLCDFLDKPIPDIPFPHRNWRGDE